MPYIFQSHHQLKEKKLMKSKNQAIYRENVTNYSFPNVV